MELASKVGTENGAGFAQSAGTPCFVSTSWAKVWSVTPLDLHELSSKHMHQGVMLAIANTQDVYKQPKPRLDNMHWRTGECVLLQEI